MAKEQSYLQRLVWRFTGRILSGRLWIFTGICLLLSLHSLCQSIDTAVEQPVSVSPRFLDHIDRKTTGLESSVVDQSNKYLAKMARREQRLHDLIAKKDPEVARVMFGGAAEKYAGMGEQMRQDTGSRSASITVEYQAYTDSLRTMLHYLEKPLGNNAAIENAVKKFGLLDAKFKDADQISHFVQQRKQLLTDYINQHAAMAGALGGELNGMKQDLYYYQQQIRQYKETLNDPDKIEKEALKQLNKLPAFQEFMAKNSQLAGLFRLPANYGSDAALAGLQTRDQVASLIQESVAASGPGGMAAMQSNLQSAEGQLSSVRNKISQWGAGSSDIDMPDFKPNGQRTKTFLKRLEYGANFQTTKNSYYFPSVTDIAVSVGYKLSDGNTVGFGASYKLGWGNGINHIAFSSQGVGIRSFLDLKIKGTWFASGGFEYNYTTPIRSLQQLQSWDGWTRSGLLGVSKTVPVKTRMFKKTKVQLLWDFLSYQQMPKTKPFIFRFGYTF